MTFSTLQVRRLKARLKAEYVKERQLDGVNLHYLEGWHIISEANRIFGFDGWDRETVSNECVWRRPVENGFGAAYLVRIKVTVRAGEGVITRDGLGSAEAIASTPGQAHERAAKAAETDATKRALSTFGNPFGLSLYKGGFDASRKRTAPTSPLPSSIERREPKTRPEAAEAPVRLPAQQPSPAAVPRRIDKTILTFGEPKRLRRPDHLRFVATKACLVCGRIPSQAHHLRFRQPRAMSRKVSDEFTVPLCALHHHDLHHAGDEQAWWDAKKINPSPVAEALWQESRSGSSEDLGSADGASRH